MEEEKIERIKAISQRTWLRHFDNRLGLAEEELARYDRENPSLPAREPLLRDGSEHLIERIGFDEENYRKEGFKLEVPKYLYNRGRSTISAYRKGPSRKKSVSRSTNMLS